MHVTIARVYDSPRADQGNRILVDRLWPRGIAKADAPFDQWLKEVAPSTELRRWYGHDPDLFDEFARRYRGELASSPANKALETLEAQVRSAHVVLVTATRDIDHSGAKVLHDVLTHSASG